MTFCIGCIDWTAAGAIATFLASIVAIGLAIWPSIKNYIYNKPTLKSLAPSPVKSENCFLDYDLFIQLNAPKIALKNAKLVVSCFNPCCCSEPIELPPTPFIWARGLNEDDQKNPRDIIGSEVIHILSIREKENSLGQEYKWKLAWPVDEKLELNNLLEKECKIIFSVRILAENYVGEIQKIHLIKKKDQKYAWKLQLETPT